MMLKEEIRSSVTLGGMILYTPDQSEACVALETNGDGFKVKNEPAVLWTGKEEMFNLMYYDTYSEKEAIFLILRLIVEFFSASFFPLLAQKYTTLSAPVIIGITILLYSMVYIFEFSIMKGIHRRKTSRGKKLSQRRAALNMTLNAFEEYHRIPSKEEIQRASMYRADKDHNMGSHESVGILFAFASIPFFMPNIFMAMVSIPIIIILMIYAYKTSFFGLLKLTSVAIPEKYDLDMAEQLVTFWYQLSYGTTLYSYKI